MALPISHNALAADAPVAVVESNALATDIANYEEQLADLESQFGPYHRSLLEPLQSLSELAQQEGNFDRVAELHNRQLQVMRTVLGLQLSNPFDGAHSTKSIDGFKRELEGFCLARLLRSKPS